MSDSTPIAKNLETLRAHVVGKSIAFVQVCGINTLKTLDPPLAVLADDLVTDLIADDQQRSLKLVTRGHVLTFDLARTGMAMPLSSATAWSPADRTPMPTVRIGFADQTGVDLKEPAKTKRITLAVRTV